MGRRTSAQALLHAAVGRPATHAAASSLQHAAVTYSYATRSAQRQPQWEGLVLAHRLGVGYEFWVARARREGCRAARGGGVDCVLHADHREEVAAGRLHREEYLHTPEPTTVVQSLGCLHVAGTHVRAGDAAGGGEAGDARRGRLVAAGFVDQLRVHGELRVGATRKRLAVWLRWWWWR